MIHNKYQLENIKISAFDMKMIAIFAMVIDHIGWVFIETGSILGQTMHLIGRLTLPLMCFLLVEGYFHSRNLKKYIIRLFSFALLSQIPFIMMNEGVDKIFENPSLMYIKGNILFNLLLGLLSLIIYQSSWRSSIRFLMTVSLILLSTQMDWGEYVIVFCLVFLNFRDSRIQQVFSYITGVLTMLVLTDLSLSQTMPLLTIQWWPIGMLLATPFIYLYNGEKGSDFGGRYFFYLFYPIHMIFLVSIHFVWFDK